MLVSSTVLSQRSRGFSSSFPDLPDISLIKLDSGNGSGVSLPIPCDVISEEEQVGSFSTCILPS